ncbi:MAG: SelB C-terminal domain-containing protein [Hyphomicrobiales bacterium]|nr:SelB C-terminal domain-containing protein [Hyphomicrobiales bacterium]
MAEALDITPEELTPLLEKLGRIDWLTRVSRAYFMLPEIIGSFAAEAERAGKAHEKSLLTIGNFRDATGANRHVATPLLEFFD